MKSLKRTLLTMTAIAALSASASISFASDDEAKNEASDDWHIDLSDHWANSVSDNDESITGYVATVDYPNFTLRTHTEGTLKFVIPETTEYADDLQTGKRIQVWYDPEDRVTGDDGDFWLIIHGFGVHAADMTKMHADAADDPDHQTAAEKKSLHTDDPNAVQTTALPPGSQPGPGPNAYTITGEIVEVNPNSIVLDTIVGKRIVRIVEQIDKQTALEEGNEVAIEFHRGDPVIHAKVVRDAS